MSSLACTIRLKLPCANSTTACKHGQADKQTRTHIHIHGRSVQCGREARAQDTHTYTHTQAHTHARACASDNFVEMLEISLIRRMQLSNDQWRSCDLTGANRVPFFFIVSGLFALLSQRALAHKIVVTLQPVIDPHRAIPGQITARRTQARAVHDVMLRSYEVEVK